MTPFARVAAAVLPAWRRLCDRTLPLWHFLGRRARLERLHALQAELRCERCRLQPRCRRRVARHAFRPPQSCPNAALLA